VILIHLTGKINFEISTLPPPTSQIKVRKIWSTRF